MRILTPFEVWAECGLVANLASTCGDAEVPMEGLDLSEDQKERIYGLARLTLNALTAGVVANCPVTVRPCSPRYSAVAASWSWSGLTWSSPYDPAGWLNACGCQYACACTTARRLDLNGPVAEVLGVTIDGDPVPESEYRLEGDRWLVRDSEWPTTQNMDAALTDLDTFGVTYRPGYALGHVGEGVYGMLIHEYAKAACGQKCRLPTGVTSITRNGVTMQINRGLFHDGLTGIPEVDAYIAALNPFKLRQVPTFASPDLREHRSV